VKVRKWVLQVATALQVAALTVGALLRARCPTSVESTHSERSG
jgi:hypothetical protein